MKGLSVFCIVFGILIVVSRGPLIFAPNATLRAWDRLIFATNARLRAFGVFVGILAVSLILLPFGEGGLAKFLHGLGWVVAAETLWILLLPNLFRGFARSVFHFLESSVDDVILRFGGLLAVLAGLALVYVGIYVV